MVQETTSTQPGRCLGRLCGTNSVLCVKKTVPHYLADPAFYPSNDTRLAQAELRVLKLRA